MPQQLEPTAAPGHGAPASELLQETRTFAGMIVSLSEESEAISWYQQRIAVVQNSLPASTLWPLTSEQLLNLSTARLLTHPALRKEGRFIENILGRGIAFRHSSLPHMTEWDAAEYSRRSSLQEAMAQEVLALLELDGSERILDVGCGDGKITAEIASRAAQGSVVGVDPSRDMIGFAQSHFGPATRANLRFQVADARRLPFKNEFDLVVSFNALHWIPEQDAALSSIRCALVTGGRAQLRLVPAGARRSLEDVVDENRRASKWSAYFRDFRDPYLHLTADEYAAMAERNGFRVLRLSTKDHVWDFGSRPAFAAFCAVGCVEWTRRLPQAERSDFINDVLDRYQTIAAKGSGENTFKFYQMDISLLAK